MYVCMFVCLFVCLFVCRYEEQVREKRNSIQKEDLSDMVAEHAAKQKVCHPGVCVRIMSSGCLYYRNGRDLPQTLLLEERLQKNSRNSNFNIFTHTHTHILTSLHTHTSWIFYSSSKIKTRLGSAHYFEADL